MYIYVHTHSLSLSLSHTHTHTHTVRVGFARVPVRDSERFFFPAIGAQGP